jgi:hypothetical protein
LPATIPFGNTSEFQSKHDWERELGSFLLTRAATNRLNAPQSLELNNAAQRGISNSRAIGPQSFLEGFKIACLLKGFYCVELDPTGSIR